MTRGDTLKLKFQRRNKNNQVILTLPSEIYFTVKANKDATAFLIQKRLSDMTFDNDGTYHILLKPCDTEKLPYGTYFFDIEVDDGSDYTFTISKGYITLTAEATWSENK